MSSKTKKLTKSVVDGLMPTGKLFRLFDSEVKGFSVALVHPVISAGNWTTDLIPVAATSPRNA